MSPYASYLSLKLGYDWIEDTAQIALEIQASTVMARYGITEISVDTAVACFSPPPAPPVIVVTEYHNATTDHYFMSSSAAENAFIDSGGAGAFRGGLGVRTRIRTLADGRVNVAGGDGGRLTCPPWGLLGGGSGSCVTGSRPTISMR